MLKAYLDDAGSLHDHPCLVLGGFVAHATTWKRVERQWEALEVKKQIGHWHTSKMRAPGSSCHGWGKKPWYRLRADMMKPLIRPDFFLVGASMLADTWNLYGDRFNKAMRDLHPSFRDVSAFGFLVNHILQQVASVTEHHFENETIGVFIERPATGLKAELERILEAYIQTPPWSRRITSKSVGDRDTYPALRVADFGASGMFRYGRKKALRNPAPDLDPLSNAITKGELGAFARFWSNDEMNGLLAMIGRGDRVRDWIP